MMFEGSVILFLLNCCFFLCLLYYKYLTKNSLPHVPSQPACLYKVAINVNADVMDLVPASWKSGGETGLGARLSGCVETLSLFFTLYHEAIVRRCTSSSRILRTDYGHC